jgi:hypothetical protein
MLPGRLHELPTSRTNSAAHPSLSFVRSYACKKRMRQSDYSIEKRV